MKYQKSSPKLDFSLQDPREIYRKISNEINILYFKMEEKSSNEKIQQLKEVGQKALSAFYKTTLDGINQLDKHAEWETFTISFFGETNAGKSTLIECLRIALQEESKLKDQQKFKTTKNRIQHLDDYINQLNLEIKNHKSHYIKTSDEILEIQQSLEKHKHHKISDAFHRKYQIKSLQQKKQNIADQIIGIESKKNEISGFYEDLNDIADGSIIGDGRSDFTRLVKEYKFSFNSQNFKILDVPGIEGKETIVEAEISKSVKKSHVIFYVTSKDAPPNAGTLEKIQSYLNDQVEIWSIYNKQITNPRALKKDLISSDDENSLLSLDNIMIHALGDKNYKGHIALAGLPAFFSLAKCLIPFSDQSKQQNKFLDRKDSKELLELSRFSEFQDLLISKIIGDVEYKIRKANFSKADRLLKNGVHNLKSIHQNFQIMQDNLGKIFENSMKEIDSNINNLKSDFVRNSHNALNNFKKDSRADIYQEIENKIDNSEFKSKFETILKIKLNLLQKDLELNNQKSLSDFESLIKATIEKMQTRMEDLIYSQQQHSPMKNIQLDLRLKLDSGVNKWGLLGTAVGIAAAMWWNPVGWVMGVLTGVGLMISFAKAIWSVFDSNYRKSQQRQNVDANLPRIADKVHINMQDSLNALMPKIESELDLLKTQLKQPLSDIAKLLQALDQAIIEFDRLSIGISQQYGAQL